ncbi:nucleotidyltransferase domain-containing protein [Desulfosporosinus sp. BICA1-9]|uniref:nucleotidyltransferase domain-containing protein n=1 Tax=Desulfosporosinus sp. BICA1-9 TaxID=1531958 RepID=UPI00054C3EC4|nr:nucleotidyltransferase domain-containing protein [Desulfosporosinus sp. BICA1-9]KJS50789.1 MAG: DNA polymerase III subunit beta [Peptococcaceae bacterium BRH_c23]KJS89540.1 MAG: DNA polymerase III subunit beta [Desulfosporosinus sp. BICA1-9]HBW37008.1 nucleotidyltransferase domain-containing protein [Desulfosporosinus sp.]
MNFGLREEDLSHIITTMKQFSEIEKAAIFGSRVKGNYKPGSDVDIAIWGNKISFSTLSRLHAILEEESPMPYFFDIVDYSHLNHKDLKGHIDRVGIVFFTRDLA